MPGCGSRRRRRWPLTKRFPDRRWLGSAHRSAPPVLKTNNVARPARPRPSETVANPATDHPVFRKSTLIAALATGPGSRWLFAVYEVVSPIATYVPLLTLLPFYHHRGRELRAVAVDGPAGGSAAPAGVVPAFASAGRSAALPIAAPLPTTTAPSASSAPAASATALPAEHPGHARHRRIRLHGGGYRSRRRSRADID